MNEIVNFIKGFDIHTIIILAIAFWWLNGNMNIDLEKINNRLDSVEKDLAIIKTVLVMKNIMPTEMCKKSAEEKSTEIPHAH